MQVDPFKPTLKAPGTKRLKLKYEKLVSNPGFKLKMRRFSKADDAVREMELKHMIAAEELEAGAYTRPLSGST